MQFKASFIEGMKRVSPLLLGVMPFGVIYGVSSSSVGVGPLESILMSVFVFAGASQLAAVNLMGDNASLFVVVMTGLIINLRMAMYSASLAPHFAEFSGSWKRFAAYLLVDQAYAMSITRFSSGEPIDKKGFYLGCATALWITWQVSGALGVFMGAIIPPSLGLDFTIPLTFIALAFPVIKDKPQAAAALTAGTVTVLTYGLPYNSGLMAGTICGIAVGFFSGRRKK